MNVKLSECIAPSFYEVHNKIKNGLLTHCFFKGGRGSTKSSFISLEIILEIIRDPDANAICFRKVGATLETSVYGQMLWAIEQLGLSDNFHAYKSPLKIIYKPTGQQILFRGLDDATKIKSIKLAKGYFKIGWFEELDEFDGMEEIRKTAQSIMRGGEKFLMFYSYNPPKSQNSWVNVEMTLKNDNRYIHHSDYTTVPVEWLGSQFFIEADTLKEINPVAYDHEYLGNVTGTGGNIFENVVIEEITDEQIAVFDKLRDGLDFGFAIDPLAYSIMHYDSTRRTLYIFYELYEYKMDNKLLAQKIKEGPHFDPGRLITADSAEPKSIDELQRYGLNIEGAAKGPDSVRFGVEKLQRLVKIVIDKKRCPNTAREFLTYEHDRTKSGEWKNGYPDKNNHTIDDIRYALEKDFAEKVVRVFSF